MNLPEQLFRYRSGSTDFLALELQAALRNEVWCNRMDELNDPFEAQPVQVTQTRKEVADWIKEFRDEFGYVSTTGQSYYELANKLGISKSKVRKIFGNPLSAASHEINSFGDMCQKIRELGTSCSFSEIETSASMWALYGGNHKGYSQIWVKRPEGQQAHKRTPKGLGYVVKVNYSLERPRILVTELSNMIAYVSFNSEKGPLDRNEFEQSSLKFGAMKSDEWSRECLTSEPMGQFRFI